MAATSKWRREFRRGLGLYVAHGGEWVAALKNYNEIIFVDSSTGDVMRTHVITAKPGQGIAALAALSPSRVAALVFADIGHGEDLRVIQTEIVDVTTGHAEVMAMDHFLSSRTLAVEAAGAVAAREGHEILKTMCQFQLGDRAVITNGDHNQLGDIAFINMTKTAYAKRAGQALMLVTESATAIALHPSEPEIAVARAGNLELFSF